MGTFNNSIEIRGSKHSSMREQLRKGKAHWLADALYDSKEVRRAGHETVINYDCAEISGLFRRHHADHLGGSPSHLSDSVVISYNSKPTSSLAFASSHPAIPPAKAPNTWTSRLSNNAAGAVMTTIQSG